MSKTFDVEQIKKLKLQISVPLLLVILAVAWKGDDGILYWLDDTFVSHVEAADLAEQVKGAVDTSNATSQALIAYIRKEEIQAARGELRSLEDAMQETLLWESQNGENTISEARKEDIGDRIDEVEVLLDCLEAGRDDCNA